MLKSKSEELMFVYCTVCLHIGIHINRVNQLALKVFACFKNPKNGNERRSRHYKTWFASASLRGFSWIILIRIAISVRHRLITRGADMSSFTCRLPPPMAASARFLHSKEKRRRTSATHCRQTKLYSNCLLSALVPVTTQPRR